MKRYVLSMVAMLLVAGQVGCWGESEPMLDNPEPVANEPEPVADEPEPVANEPEPVANEPEPVANEPEQTSQEDAVAAIEELGGYISFEGDTGGTIDFVSLRGTAVTDTGLKHLEGMTDVIGLDLGAIGVTDTGLEHLKGLARLEELNLIGSQVTDEGVEKLQQALPNCKIIHSLSLPAENDPGAAAPTPSQP